MLLRNTYFIWCIYISVETGLGHPGHVFVQVIQVRLTLEIIQDYIMWGAKLRKARYGSTTTDATATFAYHEPHSLLATMIFAGCKWRENHTPRFLYVYAWNNCHLQLHRAMPINPLLLEEFYPCSKRILFCNHVQQTYSLHKATSTYTSHVLVSASLQVAIPTETYLFLVSIYC